MLPPAAAPARPLVGLWLIVCLAVATHAADPIKEVGQTASEWVKTRSETVRLETEWKQNRALLSSTIDGLKDRADRLQDKRDHLLSATAEDRAEQAALAAKLAASQESFRLTETRLQAVTEKVLRMRPQLPPMLSSVAQHIWARRRLQQGLHCASRKGCRSRRVRVEAPRRQLQELRR